MSAGACIRFSTCFSAIIIAVALFSGCSQGLQDATSWYNSARETPLGFEHYVEYAQKHSCAQGPYKGIEGDLAPFRDPLNPEKRSITKELIKEAKAFALGKDDAVLFRIQGGNAVADWEEKIVYPSWATDFGSILLDRLKELAPYLPDMELIVNLHDFPKVLPGARDSGGDQSTFDDVEARFDACTGADQQFRKFRHLHHTHGGQQLNYSTQLFPIFSQTKVAGCHGDIQYPSLYNWGGLLSEKDQQELLPWEERNETLIFRGSTTGGHYNRRPTGGEYLAEEYFKLHRFRLVEKFKNTPHMDFQFTAYSQCHNVCAKLEEIFGSTAPRMSPGDMLGKYKYLMAVEGNSFLSRWPKYLSSGALSFRAGLFREWFDEWMLPFDGDTGHYIPVEFDYSDLEAKLHWALDHDDTARKIAAAARGFANTRLRNEDLICYLWRLLLEYGALVEQ